MPIKESLVFHMIRNILGLIVVFLFHFLVSLQPCVRAHGRVKHEAEKKLAPGRALLQSIIKLGRRGLHLWETKARDARKVMVLVVVSDIEAHVVQRTVVRRGVLHRRSKGSISIKGMGESGGVKYLR